MLILTSVFFAALFIQVCYVLFFIVAFTSKRIKSGEDHNMGVSVIVCAHDEEANLRELIPLLLAQSYKNFEVIVVNDRSNDNTYDFLLEETKKDDRLRMVNVDYLPPHVTGKKYALTLGIKAARNEWVLLTDADCRPAGTNWIASMSADFAGTNHFVLGVSPYLRRPGFLNMFIRFESFLTAFQYMAFAIANRPYMGVGRNLAYRKSMFLEKKGFHQYVGVTGGDDDLFVNQHANSANTAFSFRSDTLMFSIPKPTFRSFFHQKIRHLSVGKHYRLRDKLIVGLMTVTWMITWFAGIPLLFVPIFTPWVAGFLFLRILLLIMLFRIALKRVDLDFEWWVIPVLDFLYSIYYLSTALSALLTKNVRWKN